MYESKTTYLLGAGASKHFGFPTGLELLGNVKTIIGQLWDFLEHSKIFHDLSVPDLVQEAIGQSATAEKICTEIVTLQHQCDLLRRRLETGHPTVIDYFIGLNPDVAHICKLLVAKVIIDAEILSQDAALKNTIRAAEQNWLRFVANNLKANCRNSDDLMKNNINFLTFNYDTSLEDELEKMLLSDYIFRKEDVEAFLQGDRIIHLYGSIPRHQKAPEGIPRKPEGYSHNELSQLNYKKLCKEYNRAYEVSKNLSVIDPDDKITNISRFNKAKEILEESDRVYILGYGFDENNSKRLDLPNSLRKKPRKTVLFTNYGAQIKIDALAGAALHGDETIFVEARKSLYTHVENVYWRSTNNVYDALQHDFR